MAAVSQVPVVNALTDEFHPCQILADLQTIREHKGRLAGLTLTYVGDAANNMAHSYLLGGASAGMHVRVAGPSGTSPTRRSWPTPSAWRRRPAARYSSPRTPPPPSTAPTSRDRHLGLDGPGGRGDGSRSRSRRMRSTGGMARADPDAIVLHCLPAYRGKEIAADVIDGPQSVVWDEAENRLARAESAAHLAAGAQLMAVTKPRDASLAPSPSCTARPRATRGSWRILDARPVRSQAELRGAPGRRGVHVTQATLSRDLDELGAVKLRTPDGGQPVYVVPEDGAPLAARLADDAPPRGWRGCSASC